MILLVLESGNTDNYLCLNNRCRKGTADLLVNLADLWPVGEPSAVALQSRRICGDSSPGNFWVNTCLLFKLDIPSLVTSSTDFFCLVPTLLRKVLLLATSMCANTVGLWFHNNSLLHGDVFLQETCIWIASRVFWFFGSVTSRNLVMSWNGHMQDLGWNIVIHMMCTLKSRVAWS